MGDGGRHFSGSTRHQQFLASFIPRNGDRLAITGLWEGHITARITITNSNDEHHGCNNHVNIKFIVKAMTIRFLAKLLLISTVTNGIKHNDNL